MVIAPDVFERDCIILTRDCFLRIEGQLQIQDGVIHVKAQHIAPLKGTSLEVRSHDFH